MKIIKNKKIIIPFACIFLTGIIITVYLLVFQYKEENITEVINNYLTDRYNGIQADNFNDSIDKQKLYYSSKLHANPTWVNNKRNIEDGRKYFEETRYSSQVLTSSVEKKSRNKYLAKFSVLYLNGIIADENYTDYEFVFTVKKKGFNDYVFDNVELASGITTFTNGGELHLHDGEVVLVNGEDHSDCDDHSHNHVEDHGNCNDHSHH